MSGSGPALELRGVRRHFGPVAALDGASLVVDPGTLHVVLGENGAGKTTLLRIAAGLEHADAGTVLVEGYPTTRHRDAIRTRTIAVVAQHYSLIPAMTVAENVALSWRGIFAHFRPAAVGRAVADIAARAGLVVDPHARVADLPVSAQQRVEILKAMAVEPRILVLDEPTAVLAPPEANELFAWLRRFVETGHTAVVITHRLRDALRHADAITVLRRGRTVLVTTPAAATEATLIGAIVGDESGVPEEPRSSDGGRVVGPVILAARGVTVTRSRVVTLRDATLEVRGGELVGVAGVEGAGQADLLRVLAGRVRPVRGTVVIPDHVGFIPEDRHRDALIEDLTLRENFLLRGIGQRRGVIDWMQVDRHTRAAITAFDVRGGNEYLPAAALSGGNQQRFVLARELAGAPPAVVAENPTRGLDVRASQMIRHRLREACRHGAAVLMYSSDVEELLAVADRIVVCHGGTVHGVAPTFSAIGAAMVSPA